MDNPFKKRDYAKLCMPPLWDELCQICDNTRGHYSPLTLYIDFSQFFNFSWISIVLLIKCIHKCMYIHLSPEHTYV